MFSDFEKAFFNDKEIEKKIPKEIVKSLSEKLPKGFKYVNITKDACAIVPTSNEFNIKCNVDISDKIFDNFKPSSSKELMEFMYRIQRNLRVCPDEEGCILFNGVKIKLDDIIKFPLENVEMDFGLYMVPYPFKKPFKILIESDNIKKEVSVQRQPYPSLNKSLFKSVYENLFIIEYIIDEKNNSVNFKFNIDIEKGKNVKEIVEVLKLYLAFLEGKIKIEGEQLPKSYTYNKDINIETIKFWEKVRSIETKLNIEFEVEFPVTRDDSIWIEKLYMNYVENKPFKKYVNIDKITVTGTDDLGNKINNKNIMFSYIEPYMLDMWGIKLEMYDCVELFNFRINDSILIDEDLKKYELTIEPIEDKGVSKVSYSFINKEEAYKYHNKKINL